MAPAFTSRLRRATPWAVGFAVVVAGVTLALPRGRAAATNRPPAEVAIVRSIFVTNDPAGVDPFFPTSTRRKTQPATTDPAKPRITGVGALQLKGIMGPPERRIALINNLTFAKGETNDVRVPTGTLKIICVDIRQKSVVVVLEGQTEQHELILPEKVLTPTE